MRAGRGQGVVVASGCDMRGWLRLAGWALLLVIGGAASAAAPASGSAPSAEGLALECPRDVVRREPFRCRLRVTVPDHATAGGLLELRVALQGPLLRVSSSPEMVFDDRARAWSWRGAATELPRNHEVEVVTEDSQGFLQAEVATWWVDPDRKAPPEARQVLRIVHHPAPRLRVGGAWLPGAPIVWFTSLLATEVALLVLVWRLRRRRGAPGLGTVLVCVVLGNLSLMLNAGVIDDLRARYRYEAATCEVLDRTAWSHWPLAAMRYAVSGRSVVSAGFESRNRFYGSGDGERASALTPGARVPCWFDPAHPTIVVVDRTPSIVMWLVGAVALGSWLLSLRAVWRSRQSLR